VYRIVNLISTYLEGTESV